LTNPVNNSVFLPGAPITLSASASAPGGTVAKVEFFADGGRLGETPSAPYSLVWSNAIIGTHLLQASQQTQMG